VGRMGYLRWRTDLKTYHAQRLAEIMAKDGFDQETIDRVGALVRKERLKQDAEVQALEDVVCVVFLTHYLANFAAKHDDDKVADVLAKTWRKMSSQGHAAAESLGRVDGFDDDEAQSECDEGCKVLVRFLATERNALEALELADQLLDTGAGSIECLREEGWSVLGR
jgi:Domain of unknown function (DUF4202)